MNTPVQTTRYGIIRTVHLPYDQALEKTRVALKEQGFGVLSEIDVQKAMKEKLGQDYPRYLILGACNPHLAHQALQIEPELGLLLPCNVVVREKNGHTEVAAVDAAQMLTLVGNERLQEIAEEANQRLRQALDRIC